MTFVIDRGGKAARTGPLGLAIHILRLEARGYREATRGTLAWMKSEGVVLEGRRRRGYYGMGAAESLREFRFYWGQLDKLRRAIRVLEQHQ